MGGLIKAIVGGSVKPPTEKIVVDIPTRTCIMKDMEDTLTINGVVATEVAELEWLYSWGEIPIGKRQNRFEYRPETVNTNPYIIWNWWSGEVPEDEAEDMDEVVIGLTIKANTLVDYDGVFQIPETALRLLEHNGVDCTQMRKDLED